MEMNKKEKWLESRSRFNHDKLKNKYIDDLGGLIANLNQSKQSSKKIDRFIDITMPEWDNLKIEVKLILDSFKSSLSPSYLFEKKPLSRNNKEDNKWVKSLTNIIWENKNNINEKLDEAYKLLEQINNIHKKISNIIKNFNNDPIKMKKEINVFQEYMDILKEFSNVLSSLINGN